MGATARPDEQATPVRRIVGRDRDGFQVDDTGRRHLTRFHMGWVFRAVPGLGQQFKRVVPDEFWARETDEDGGEIAVIACPCGEEPRVSPGRLTECECERFYLHLGKRIKVANSPPSTDAS